MTEQELNQGGEQGETSTPETTTEDTTAPVAGESDTDTTANEGDKEASTDGEKTADTEASEADPVINPSEPANGSENTDGSVNVDGDKVDIVDPTA